MIPLSIYVLIFAETVYWMSMNNVMMEIIVQGTAVLQPVKLKLDMDANYFPKTIKI